MVKHYKNLREKRHLRVRAKISGTANRPRLCVFRSNTYIYAQIIDDNKGETLVAFGDSNKEQKTKNKKQRTKNKEQNKTVLAKWVGQELAKQALKVNIKSVVFDRGGYKYHGRVKALAEGAREAGLKF